VPGTLYNPVLKAIHAKFLFNRRRKNSSFSLNFLFYSPTYESCVETNWYLTVMNIIFIIQNIALQSYKQSYKDRIFKYTRYMYPIYRFCCVSSLFPAFCIATHLIRQHTFRHSLDAMKSGGSAVNLEVRGAFRRELIKPGLTLRLRPPPVPRNRKLGRFSYL